MSFPAFIILIHTVPSEMMEEYFTVWGFWKWCYFLLHMVC